MRAKYSTIGFNWSSEKYILWNAEFKRQRHQAVVEPAILNQPGSVLRRGGLNTALVFCDPVEITGNRFEAVVSLQRRRLTPRGSAGPRARRD